jgi:hypothetical protein
MKISTPIFYLFIYLLAYFLTYLFVTKETQWYDFKKYLFQIIGECWYSGRIDIYHDSSVTKSATASCQSLPVSLHTAPPPTPHHYSLYHPCIHLLNGILILYIPVCCDELSVFFILLIYSSI